MKDLRVTTCFYRKAQRTTHNATLITAMIQELARFLESRLQFTQLKLLLLASLSFFLLISSLWVFEFWGEEVFRGRDLEWLGLYLIPLYFCRPLLLIAGILALLGLMGAGRELILGASTLPGPKVGLNPWDPNTLGRVSYPECRELLKEHKLVDETKPAGGEMLLKRVHETAQAVWVQVLYLEVVLWLTLLFLLTPAVLILLLVRAGMRVGHRQESAPPRPPEETASADAY
jgi:hypothetical protein